MAMHLLVWVVDWCVTLLVKRNCCRIILTASIPGRLLTFVFRWREVRRLLPGLDPHGGTDPLSMFPLFLKRTADVMAPPPRPIEKFRWLVRLCSFSPYWREANVPSISKGPQSSSVANYQQISITSVFPKVFEHLVYVSGRSMKCNGVLPTTRFASGKGLSNCDALSFTSHKLQSGLESGKEARIVQIDFSAVFDDVNHQGILYRLYSLGIGGSVLSILTQFLSNRSQHVMVDGLRSKLLDAVSGEPQVTVLDPLLFLLFTSQLSSILENSWSVMPMTLLWLLLCNPQVLELQKQSRWSTTLVGLVSGVFFGEWNWMRVRPRLW